MLTQDIASELAQRDINDMAVAEMLVSEAKAAKS